MKKNPVDNLTIAAVVFAVAACGFMPRTVDAVCTPDFAVTAPGQWTHHTCGAGDDCSMMDGEEHIYEVTIPADGDWIFSLCGSSFDTFIYVGTTCGNVDIGYDDNSCGPGMQSLLKVSGLTAGTYYVAVDGMGTNCGDYVLNIRQCGDGICSTGENSGNCCDDCGAVCGDGACNCGEDDTRCLADCDSCGNGMCGPNEDSVNCCDDCGAVCGDGPCNCGEDETTCADDCGDSFVVTAPGQWMGNNCGAGDDCDVTAVSGYPDNEEDIYEVTIPTDGDWTFSLCGSSYDTLIMVGTAACDDDIGFDDLSCGPGFQSVLRVPGLTAGTYYVVVDGFGSSCGDYVLDIQRCGDGACGAGENSVNCCDDCGASCGDGVCNCGETPADCPADCPASDAVVTAPGEWTQNTCGAGDDCDVNGSDNEDHIYEVTIPTTGDWIFTLAGSFYDTKIMVGTTSCVDDIGYDDDGGPGLQSELAVTGLAAGTYYVVVDGFSTKCGDYVLGIRECGDGTCDNGEDTSNCASDCGSQCGDRSCNGSEDSVNCCVDCGPVCDDGACNCGENDTNCPTDCPGVACPTGETMDCYGNCAPSTWLGDGTCDNGLYQHNGVYIFFNCSAFNNDEGDCDVCGDGWCGVNEDSVNCCPDCGPACGDGACNCGEDDTSCAADCAGFTCPSGEIMDCSGNCAPATWIGDFNCDDGARQHNGVYIFFNCPAFNIDNGDCDVCGDGTCGLTESSADCCQDCGASCGDGTCNCSENPCNCAADCTGCCDNSDCDDSNPCTDDSCDITHTCHYTNNPGPCDDGLFCNGTDTCDGGACSVHSGDPCPGPDGDDDCAESCDEGTASCTASDPNDSVCDDGELCTENDVCSGGVCSGTPMDCDDGIACTADSCVNGVCQHDYSGCDCEFDADCDDSNVCTDDACVNGICENTNNTDPCDDGDVCTENDVCNEGICSGTPIPDCCPDGDDDADGVCNSVDNCPGTPAGRQVNASGCTISFVRATAIGSNDGTSWEHAYSDLQDALDEAAADGIAEIWVGAGTYTPDQGTGNRSATFQLINAVAIFGGFPDVGGDWAERDPGNPTNNTVLSGDIGLPGVNLDNSLHVVTGSGTDNTAVLDGFTITAGLASEPAPNDGGGGLLCDAGSPTIVSCQFTGNIAAAGAGVGINNSSPLLTDCSFNGNAAQLGGGMVSLNGNPTLTGCQFIGNVALASGGGMLNLGGQPSLVSCVFAGNLALENGGGVFNQQSSPSIVNGVLAANRSGNAGGAIFNFMGGTATLTNCTIIGNVAEAGGGLCNLAASPTMTNCIIWLNYSTQILSLAGSSPAVTYCNIQGGGIIGVGNIDTDPLLVNLLAGDLRLQGGSPCIDAGNNNAIPGSVTTDALGDARLVDDPDVPDTGSGTPPIVDMGAYERQVAIPLTVNESVEVIDMKLPAGTAPAISGLDQVVPSTGIADVGPISETGEMPDKAVTPKSGSDVNAGSQKPEPDRNASVPDKAGAQQEEDAKSDPQDSAQTVSQNSAEPEVNLVLPGCGAAGSSAMMLMMCLALLTMRRYVRKFGG